MDCSAQYNKKMISSTNQRCLLTICDNTLRQFRSPH